MVNACFFEYPDKTLAALPVGASNELLFATTDKLFTSVETKVVFPVPAYPFSKKTVLGLTEKIKSEIAGNHSFWDTVGLKLKFASSREQNFFGVIDSFKWLNIIHFKYFCDSKKIVVLFLSFKIKQ